MYGITVSLWGFTIAFVTVSFNKKQKVKTRSQQYKRVAAIFYHKHLIFPTMLILLLSTILISVQLATLGNAYQISSITSMGEYTNNVTSWLQLTVLISTFVLALISITECVNTLLSERRSEFYMYHVIGWRRAIILFHLLKETTTWTVLALVIDAVLGSI